MRRLEKVLVALLLSLGAVFSVTAQEAAQPVEPITPAPEMAEEVPDVSWVRLAHFSPNASEVSVSFRATDEETAQSVDADQFQSLSYQTLSEYVEIPAGNYTVSIEGAEGVDEQEFSFARGNYYTLAAMGMVLPEEAQAEQEEEEDQGGFLGFFQNLFGAGDGDRDRLALQFKLIEDDLTRVPEEGETLVRLVHAAPGIEAVDLAVKGEEGTIANNVEFGKVSGYESYAGGMESLELRLSGSRAAAIPLETLSLQAGNINTIFVVGTPVEAAPVAIIGSSLAPVEVGMPAGEELAAEPMTIETAGGGGGEEGQREEGEETEQQQEGEANEDTEEAEGQEDAENEAMTDEAEAEDAETTEPEMDSEDGEETQEEGN